MEEMRGEAFVRAEQERIEEDQRRAEEAAARLAEEDRLEEEANRLLALEEQRSAQEREAELEAKEAKQQQQQEEELRRIAAAEEAARLAAEAEAAMLLAEQEANRLEEEQASAEALASLALDDGTKEKEEDDIAAQARAAVEAMEKQAEGLPGFDEGEDSFLGEEDLEGAIALAQELQDEKIAGVDDLLQALRELDVDDDFEGEDDDQVPDFDKNDPINSNAPPTQEQEQSPEDLAKAAREAVAVYEAEMAAKSQERKAQKSEWAKEAAAVASTDGIDNTDASPPTTTTTTTTTDWASLTVVKLKDELRSRGLKVAGRKAELVLRLQEDDMSR